jgi:hypothetical protein
MILNDNLKKPSYIILSLVAILLGSLSFYLLNINYFTFLDFYYSLIVFLIAGGFILGFKREDIFPTKKAFTLFCSSLLFFTIIRLLKLEEQSFWIDEYFQYSFIKVFPKKNIVPRIVFDGHPPIDYLFQNLIINLFGTSIFTLRVHAVIWSLFSFSLCYQLGRKLKNTPTMSLLGCWLLFSHPYILAYQVEGRLYSLAILASLLILYCHLQAYEENTPKSLLLVLSANLFGFFSVSVQSFIFVGVLSLFFFMKSKNRSYLLLNTLSYLTLIPGTYYFFFTKDSYILTILESVENSSPSFFEVIKHIKFLFLSAKLWWGLFLLLITIGFLKMEKVTQKTELLRSFVTFLLYLALCLGFFYYFFKIPIFSRYLLMGLSLCLFIFYTAFKEVTLKKHDAFVASTLLIAFNIFLFLKPIGEYSSELKRAPWNRVIKIVNHYDLGESSVAFININSPEWMRVKKIIGLDFYASENLIKAKLENKNWPASSKFSVFVNPTFDYCRQLEQDLYLIYQKDMNHENINLKKLAPLGHRVLLDDPQLQLAKIKSKGSYYETYKAYFQQLLRTFGENPETSSIIDSYAVLEYFFGEEDAYLKPLASLRKLSHIPLLKTRVKELEQSFSSQDQRRPCQ